ncbi:MAG: DNA starvation/stationary phase protection protein [Planctomycetota bacterium]
MSSKTSSRSRSRIRSPRNARATTSVGKNGVLTRIGLSKDQRHKVAELLGRLVADQHVLYQKTRVCHWNLIGGRFDPLHKLFEALYEQLAEAIDATAERIRMLDAVSPGAMRELLDLARLSEVPGRLVTGQQALNLLYADHEAVIRTLRDDIRACEEEHDDVGTADLLTGLLRAHEKTAWMLRSHLEA